MIIGKKAFLDRDPLSEDFVSWYFNGDMAISSGIFNISYGRVVVSLHTPDFDHSRDAMIDGFTGKLQALADALKAAAIHVPGQCTNHRQWLNPETTDVQHMTGHVAWGDNGSVFYVTVSDCQRAWRIAISYRNRFGKSVMRKHQNKLLVIIKHLENAIKEISCLKNSTAD